MKLIKNGEFSAAHYLPGYVGKCGNLHGHTWQWEVIIKSNLDPGDAGFPENGILVDFRLIKMWIDDKFDHTNLNDFMEKPTAENVAKEIANEIWQGLAILESGIPTAYSYPNLFKSIKVRLWENKDARVEIKIKCDQIRTNDSGEN